MRFVDSGSWRGPTRLTRRGMRSGSGSARLDLYVGDSQKGPEVLAEPTASEHACIAASLAAATPRRWASPCRLRYSPEPTRCWNKGADLLRREVTQLALFCRANRAE